MTHRLGADEATAGGSTAPSARRQLRGLAVEGALLRRAVVRWLLLRLLLLAVAALATRSPAEAWQLYVAATTSIIVVALAPALAEVEVRRRHERALLENLGVPMSRRVLLALLGAIAGELLLALILR